MNIRITQARKIYGDGKHNAFTGMAAAFGQTFVSFRSASRHMSPDGAVRVIASADHEQWETVLLWHRPKADLRDPKPVFFNDQLWVYFAQKSHKALRRMMAITSPDGKQFTEPAPLNGIPEGHWLWHPRAYNDHLYGTVYHRDPSGLHMVALYGSTDGQNWEHRADFPTAGNEAWLDFDQSGTLWALVREDHFGYIPTLCTAEPPYNAFQSMTRLPMRLHGPMLKRLEGGCAIICRQWDPPGWRNVRTELFWYADAGALCRIAALPSGGDTSYADWLDVESGRAVVSYYTSHEHAMDEPFAADNEENETDQKRVHPADIYLANISYSAPLDLSPSSR